MNTIEGNIYNHQKGLFVKGKILFDSKIHAIIDCHVDSNFYIIPGFIDAHIHIESTMLTPVEYSKVAVKYGVIGAIADPHEIANVCGAEGLSYMLCESAKTPMYLSFGIPSCVPATEFETSGSVINSDLIEMLFEKEKFSHLSEVMNFPGVISHDNEVIKKIAIAKKFNKCIDGHAPKLSGDNLKKYVDFGINTDHECTTIKEALEKISLGMKIMLRKSSVSDDFLILKSLIDSNPECVMFCTDDFHPDDLKSGYINEMFKTAIISGYNLKNIVKAASINAIDHYHLPVGKLNVGDSADFILIDDLNLMNVLSTYIAGQQVWDGSNVQIKNNSLECINQFYLNKIDPEDLKIFKTGTSLNVIEIIPNSLITKWIRVDLSLTNDEIFCDLDKDLLKIVVLNRYSKAKATVGFVKGFGLLKGAFGSTISHDSHNITIIGTNDQDIFRAVEILQENRGGLVYVSGSNENILPLPVAGLMCNTSFDEMVEKYHNIVNDLNINSRSKHSNFMVLSFMSLLVIPEIKISDRGLFSVNDFKFIPLQE